jgi:hypothetical protein
MKLRTLLASLAILMLISGVAFAATKFTVTSREFDPAGTFLVQAQWLDGIGCPTNAKISTDGTTTTSHYTDPACTTGDSSDNHNQGLLLAKTGPTSNFASAVADIKGVTGPITELGYDLRKPISPVTAMGSHCGAGAPRFDITTTTASYFIGCNSPPAVQTATGNGWIRLRWGGSTPLLGFNATTGALELVAGDVKSIQIVFDEGQDTGPDFFGLAVLDNIDINGTLVGQGDNAGNKGKNKDKDKDQGDDNDQGEDD